MAGDQTSYSPGSDVANDSDDAKKPSDDDDDSGESPSSDDKKVTSQQRIRPINAREKKTRAEEIEERMLAKIERKGFEKMRTNWQRLRSKGKKVEEADGEARRVDGGSGLLKVLRGLEDELEPPGECVAP